MRMNYVLLPDTAGRCVGWTSLPRDNHGKIVQLDKSQQKESFITISLLIYVIHLSLSPYVVKLLPFYVILPEFTGLMCETMVSALCSSLPCKNNGSCNESDNSYTCDCPYGKICHWLYKNLPIKSFTPSVWGFANSHRLGSQARVFGLRLVCQVFLAVFWLSQKTLEAIFWQKQSGRLGEKMVQVAVNFCNTISLSTTLQWYSITVSPF